MSRLTAEIVDPQRLSAADIETLTDHVYAVGHQVFANLSRETVRQEFIKPPVPWARVALFRAPDGAVVGMQCIQASTQRVMGRQSTVFDAAAAMLPAWRGGASTVGRVPISAYLKVRLLHPWRPVYYFGLLIHPSSYSLFVHWTDGDLWPSPMRATPPEWHQALQDLGEAYALPRVDADRPLARGIGFSTRDSEVERRYWRQSDKASVQLFFRHVPHPEHGEGLMVLVPLGLGRIGAVLARLAAERWRALLSRSRSPGPLPGQALGVLRQSSHFSSLPADELQTLSTQLQWCRLRGGATLFRQGDACEALYLVVQGSAYIGFDAAEGDTQLIDALGPGEMLGEIAVLTGQPRTATVRAAGRLSLLRMDAKDLHALMARQPAFAQSLWRACCRRLLRGAAWNHPALAGLGLDERDRRLLAMEHRELAPDEAVPSCALRLLVKGQLQAEGSAEGNGVVLPGPALLPDAWQGKVAGPDSAILALLALPAAMTAEATQAA